MYTSGTHGDPADTRDRLVRIGSKYQATAPAVADGDNVLLLVDAAGRPLVVGAAAHDAAAAGYPLRLGGVYRTVLPTVSAADIVDLLTDAAGRLEVVTYAASQSRLGNGKHTSSAIARSAAGEATVITWTVTNGKTGYLASVSFSVKSHASETEHDLRTNSDGAIVMQKVVGQGNTSVTVKFPVPLKIVGDGSKAFTFTVLQLTTNESKYSAYFNGWEE